MSDLKNKRVIITGAGRGIGRDLAEGFAKAGAHVVLGARSTGEISAVAEGIRQAGGVAHAFTVDVTDVDQVNAFVANGIKALGGLDVLINNAGIAGSHKFATHPDELWHKTIAVNLTGLYYVTKAAVQPMIAQKSGRIINIASVAGKVGGKYIGAYNASKHGVLGLTRSLAVELAPHITVNAICPGYVDTPMTDATIENIIARTGMSHVDAVQALAGHTPLKRLVEVDEITSLALLLASDAGRGMTGQSINIDGGSVMF
ncbi:MAG: NAD(P)-dependent dehydrogenase (short-subunit alcohol dehydrogenase family) [Cellvibrionaceae bacterium]|jgi:NAD(P)-dependent dehydrogenase (short-subunit alcohol dehydrogenase family)